MLLILQQGFLFFFYRTHFLSRAIAQVLELPAHPYLATLPALYFMVLELCFTSKRKYFPQSDILLLPHYCKAILHWYLTKHYLSPFQFAVSMCQTYHYFDSCQGSIHCAFLHLYKHMQSNLFKWIVFEKYIITGGKRGQFDILIMGIIITNVTAMHMCICRDCWQDCLFSLRTQL